MQQRPKARSALAPLAAALLLFGCSSDPAAVAEADFDLGWDDGEIIVVELDDQRTFDEAMLVAPDGTEYPAFIIDRDREISRDAVQPSVGTGVAGGSGGFGVGVGLSIPLGNDEPDEINYRTRAQILVPDMAAYRAGWQNWVLRIRQPAENIWNERTLDLPAPEPPA